MKKKGALLIALTVCCILGVITFALTGTHDHLLAPADIEKVSGLKNVGMTEKNPSVGAGGDLNFVVGEGQLVMMVQVVDKSQYAGYKENFFKAAVDGVGEEAMQGTTLPGNPNNIVVFIEGPNCVALTSLTNSEGIKITVDQMVDLAKIIDSRL